MSYLFNISECHNGYYDDPEHDGCIPCPIGTYDDPDNHDSCISCPDNHTTTVEGSMDISQCHLGNL